MATAIYSYKHRQTERHVSLTKLGVVAANFAMWAGLIVTLAVIIR